MGSFPAFAFDVLANYAACGAQVTGRVEGREGGREGGRETVSLSLCHATCGVSLGGRERKHSKRFDRRSQSDLMDFIHPSGEREGGR